MKSKFIIRSVFIILFGIVMVNTIYYRYFMLEKIVLPDLASSNERIVKLFNEVIWNKNRDIVNNINNLSYNELLSDEKFIEFARNSISFFDDPSHIKVDFYDKNGERFLSTSNAQVRVVKSLFESEIPLTINNVLDNFFLQQFSSYEALYKALEGDTIHNIIPVGFKFDSISGTKEKKNFIHTFIPITYKDPLTNKVSIEGAIELYADATIEWNKIALIEQKVILVALIVFTVFFIFILYNTNYAQQIINKQQEANIQLSEAKEKAEYESSEKSEFLANISHELRTPLNAIIGFSEIILSEAMGPINNSQYKDYINDINNSGKHLLLVINDILDFSKAAADKLKVESVEVDLNKLIISSMRFVKPRAEEAMIELVEKLPDYVITIKADPKRLKQALLNLLSNAVKFTPKGGNVTVELALNEFNNKVYISVIDTGIGIAEQDIPKALSTFGQVDNTHSRKYEGTGLGLPLTKKLVELMGGIFDITSEVGIGTNVTILFDSPKILKST